MHQFAKTGQSDHGTRFKLVAQSMDPPIHCQRFAIRWLQIRCSESYEDDRPGPANG